MMKKFTQKNQGEVEGLLPRATLSILSAMVLFGSPSFANPPDLTAGDSPTNIALDINLGPTGMRGWVYRVNAEGRTADTSESRQILVTKVDVDSPAHGVLAVNDVILGADGTGADPVQFAFDSRRGLALAIAHAEAREPATLKLMRWRAGTTTTVEIVLRTMGAYSASAPYHCPKSSRILTEGAQWVFDNESSGRYFFGALSLLASGNPAYAARVRDEARALVPDTGKRDQMMSDTRDSASMITWERGHTLIFLAEYYLATGDADVLPGIEAYAVNIAKNTSLFGTVGHIFAEKFSDGRPNGPMGGVYGTVNSAGMPCFLGLLLAQKCGIADPSIQPAIDRASLFFASYTGRGAIPYGEHEPYIAHETNGKSGLAALCFALHENRVQPGKFFAKMATAAASEREHGHTGAFFNYLWSPLGAASGGEAAAAEHFKRISWHLDLARRWNGSFSYENLNGEGPTAGQTYYDFRMSTAALLVYALPLRQLHMTGRDHDPSRWLSASDVAEAVEADEYTPSSRSNSQLIADIGNWSPKVRLLAAVELNARGISAAERQQLESIATDPTIAVRARAGACEALGRIANPASAPVLVGLLTHPENHIRHASAEALRYMPNTTRLSHLNQILLAAAETARPWHPIDEEDPLQFAHGRLAMLLFYGGNAYGPKGIIWNNLAGVDRSLLYPAIRAVAASPLGVTRNNLQWIYPMLSEAEMLAVSGAIVDSVREFPPADRMFASSARQRGFALLEKHHIAEGVPAGLKYVLESSPANRTSALRTLERYGSSYTTITPEPDVIAAITPFLNPSDGSAAQNQSVSEATRDVLDGIAAGANFRTLIPLKTISSVSADQPQLALPTVSTVLRVTAFDHAQGDSVYAWKLRSGPGRVLFHNNGTAACTAIFVDRIPGNYVFEVTMSDSRALTEAHGSVSVELIQPGNPPLKIFILAGDSNMEGQGEIDPLGTPGTLETLIASHPATYGHLKLGDTWRVRDDAWIAYRRGSTLHTGDISPGYGSDSGRIGPELMFGHTMGDLHDGPVLIIKTTWGGKSLAVDFRPPSSGWSVNPPSVVGQQGYLYQQMINQVSDVLANLQTYFPYYNAANGYEIAGFGWHQGWSDRLNQTHTDEYEVNMANLIRDVRTSLGKPDLPFVIATTGMRGWGESDPLALSLMSAQLAMEDPDRQPAFSGNVAVIDTRDFYRDPSHSPDPGGTQASQWNRNAETQLLIGQSMAREMMNLISGFDFTPPVPDAATFSNPPVAISNTEITMTATVGNDPSGPVEYRFIETTGIPGGSDSGWQTSPTFTDDGLLSGTTYRYIVYLRDGLGNNGRASSPVAATTTGPTERALASQLGILDLEANGGINPNTGIPWQAGDRYRLAFHTRDGINALSNDPASYDAFVTAQAHLNPALAGTSWSALVTVNLNGNTTNALSPKSDPRVASGTDDLIGGAGQGGAGYPVYAMNGTTAIARNNADIWNDWSNPFEDSIGVANPSGNGDNRERIAGIYYSPYLDQFGNQTIFENVFPGMPVWTGTLANGSPTTLALGATSDSANASHGNSNANRASRVWNRLSAPKTSSLSLYALSEPLIVSSFIPGHPYATWANSHIGLDNRNPMLDFDRGGLATAVEWVLGGAPADGSDDAAIAPRIDNSTDPDYLIFTYRRAARSLADPGTTVCVEYCSDMFSWNEALPGTHIRITEFIDAAGPGIDVVEVRLHRSLAPEGRMFGRLNVRLSP
jgi:hypothetical protein